MKQFIRIDFVINCACFKIEKTRFFIILVTKHTSPKRMVQKEPNSFSNSNLTAKNENDSKIEFYHLNSNESLEKRIQFRQRRGPCSCFELNCGCCAGMEFQQFKRKSEFSM